MSLKSSHICNKVFYKIHFPILVNSFTENTLRRITVQLGMKNKGNIFVLYEKGTDSDKGSLRLDDGVLDISSKSHHYAGHRVCKVRKICINPIH